jgi:hypothetical protein
MAKKEASSIRQKPKSKASPLEKAQHVAQIDQDDLPGPFIVPVVSLAPKPFVVLKNIPILVEPRNRADSDELEYVARFVEANVGSCGETVEEAIQNVKDRLVLKFSVLSGMPAATLGTALVRQLAVLRSVMERATCTATI